MRTVWLNVYQQIPTLINSEVTQPNSIGVSEIRHNKKLVILETDLGMSCDIIISDNNLFDYIEIQVKKIYFFLTDLIYIYYKFNTRITDIVQWNAFQDSVGNYNMTKLEK